MRTFMYILAFLAMIGAGFWAYRENYKTQAELDRVEDLQREIGAARERLSVLNAEWAYLNRPDRLRELADINFERLGLLAFRAEQFGRVDQIAFPPGPDIELDITGAIDVTSAGGQEP